MATSRDSLDLTLYQGDHNKPACVLIHGLGMNKQMWTDPRQARIMGGLMPMTTLLSGYSSFRTLFHDLRHREFPVIAFSQSRPVGPIAVAIEELEGVLKIAARMSGEGIVMIGHSRGGLVARAAIDHIGRDDFRGLFTLCTPHGGSELATWATWISRLTESGRLLGLAHNSHMGIIGRLTRFIESHGVKELLPDSEFLASLAQQQHPGFFCMSTGGTDPALIRWKDFITLPDSLEHVWPDGKFPDEMRRMKGDGLVTALNAQMPFADEHIDFHVNHAAIAVDKLVRTAIIERIQTHCR